MNTSRFRVIRPEVLISGFFAIAAFLFANIMQSADGCVWMLLFVFAFSMLFCVRDLAEKMAAFLFFISMFTFLTATIIIRYFERNADWMLGFASDEFKTASNALFLSYFFIVFGFCFGSRIKFKIKSVPAINVLNEKRYPVEKIRTYALLVFLIAVTVNIISEIPNIIIAKTMGYMAFYNGSYAKSAVNSISKLVCRTGLFIGLAAKPSKKVRNIYMFLGIIPPP